MTISDDVYKQNLEVIRPPGTLEWRKTMMNIENISYYVSQLKACKEMGEWSPNEYEIEALRKFKEMAELFAMTTNDMSDKLYGTHIGMAVVGCNELAYLAEAVSDASRAKKDEAEKWSEIYIEIGRILEY